MKSEEETDFIDLLHLTVLRLIVSAIIARL